MEVIERCSVKVVSWINCGLGLWLIAAAFVLSPRTETVMAAESVGGIAIAVLAYASAVGRPSAMVSWAVAAAGLWTVIINYGVGTPSKLNAMAVGMAVRMPVAVTIGVPVRMAVRMPVGVPVRVPTGLRTLGKRFDGG